MEEVRKAAEEKRKQEEADRQKPCPKWSL